jgi:integrator complex subunit 4
VTPRLLTVDSPYLTTEAELEDPTYVAILVLVLSAASVNPHVLSLVPSHCLRHWRCLREKEPNVTPRIEVPLNPKPHTPEH